MYIDPFRFGDMTNNLENKNWKIFVSHRFKPRYRVNLTVKRLYDPKKVTNFKPH